jgi:uncharacterized protein YndB with AHSA1/START domain
MQITVSTHVAAPVARVWQAYTSPEDIVQWNAASSDWHTTRATVDLQVGGRFCARMEAKDGSFGFDFEGVYTALETHRLIGYEFGGRHAQVTFEEAQGATVLTVSFDAEVMHSAAQQKEGWQAILDNFKRHVEGRS